MKLVDIDRVVILMRFFQDGWDEEKRKFFDENLKMMLGIQAFDMEEHDKQIRVKTIDEFREKFFKKSCRLSVSLRTFEAFDEILQEAYEEMKEVE